VSEIIKEIKISLLIFSAKNEIYTTPLFTLHERVTFAQDSRFPTSWLFSFNE